MGVSSSQPPDLSPPGLVQRLLRRLGRLVASRQHRSLLLMRLKGAPGLFQRAPDTRENRYPVAFAFMRREIGDGPDIKILSFGCSTGEEVFSLRRYFPSATIRGIDINRGSIAQCRKRLRSQPDDRISFAVGDTPEAEPREAFDAVLCMSVLRNGELGETRPPSCEPFLRFSDYEAMVVRLAERVKPGGLLAIANSNFRFAETAVSAGFDTVFVRAPGLSETLTPIYDKGNRLLEGEFYRDMIFRKRAPAAAPKAAI